MSNGKKTTSSTKAPAKKKSVAKEVKEEKVVKKEIEKEVEVKETKMAEDFKEDNEDKKRVLIKIFDILLWIILIGWMAIVLHDYIKVTNEKDPKFCLKEETIQYEDGTVKSCTGLGYKSYEYNRESYKGIEFGPFWAKDRSEKKASK